MHLKFPLSGHLSIIITDTLKPNYYNKMSMARESETFFRAFVWKPDKAIIALSTCAQRDNEIKHKSITRQHDKIQVDNATTR